MKSKIIIIALTFLMASSAYASEVAGTFGNGGVDTPVVTSGGSSDVGGSVSSGSVGSGSSIGGNMSGTVSSGSSGGGLIGDGTSGTIASNVIGASNQGGSNLAPNTSSSFPVSASLTSSGNASEVFADNIVATTTLTTPADNMGNLGRGQLAAVGSLGFAVGSWSWWLLLLVALSILGYYTYRYNKNRKFM